MIGDSIVFTINDAFTEYSYNYKSYESDEIERDGYISVVLVIGQYNDCGKKNYGKSWFIEDYYSDDAPHYIVYSFPKDSLPDTLSYNVVYWRSINNSELKIKKFHIVRSTI